MVFDVEPGAVAHRRTARNLDQVTGIRYRYQNPAVLGTVVDISFDVTGSDDGPDDGTRDQMADTVAAALFAELDRLQAVFSAFDSESELSRWRSGRLSPSDVGDELAELMEQALAWQRLTDGLFNPLAGELSAIWAAAEQTGRDPDPSRLSTSASAITEPRFEIIDGRPTPGGDCSQLNLNAIAKGWIVDRASATTAGRFDRVDNLLVNAGGDLAHRGSGRARVGIENPTRPYDNEPPVTVFEIANEAVATSGSTRRGLSLGDRRVSHVIDPRNGQPAEPTHSVSIVAPSAMVADVVATAASVLVPADALDLVEQIVSAQDQPVAALIVDDRGRLYPSRCWRQRFSTQVRT